MPPSRDDKSIPVNINVSGRLDVSGAVSKAIEIANTIKILNDAQLLSKDELVFLKLKAGEYTTSLVRVEINDSTEVN